MMTAKRRLLAGAFERRVQTGGVWRLAAIARPPWMLYLCGLRVSGAGAAAPLSLAPGAPIEIDWNGDGDGDAAVDVTWPEAIDGELPLRADIAILHEPIDRLYAGLPLADYDPAARRFWNRVMHVAGLPGGAWLIGRIARRRAARDPAASAAATP